MSYEVALLMVSPFIYKLRLIVLHRVRIFYACYRNSICLGQLHDNYRRI